VVAERIMEVVWPTTADASTRTAVRRLLHDVVEVGGAVGWAAPPDAAEADRWLGAVMASVAQGDSALALLEVDGVAQALATWRRHPGDVFVHLASLEKVMVHPDARGLGLGRVVTAAVVEDARRTGFELLTLGVRGNNHGAVALYASLGFRVYGVLPNVIAIGDDRWDQVQMVCELERRADLTLHGSAPVGLGASAHRGA
jgi:ribosomal protein S18 acetylase RimI-like enzyme